MIHIKTSDEIEKMRIAGQLTGRVLQALNDVIKPGMTTMEIDAFCEDYIINTLGAKPGSKGQYGYPYTVNTSLNHVVCHGMPSEKQILKKGDIVNVDVTVIYEGYYGDSSKMFAVGNILPFAQKLIDTTQMCLYEAIQIVRPGQRLGDIGHTIQSLAEKSGYSVVREYCGHGIGSKMHEDPQVVHYGKAGTGETLRAGMVFTIEPMINQGRSELKHLEKDGWRIAITKDKKLSAQWEHTMLVTPQGVEVLTLRDEEQSSLGAMLGLGVE